ncbi:hypothetical protein EV652_10328 [Kribbella steppae]|uniref:Uncharacterized protein n=1 Tax=Kribbella steppae TaxID=2512223 RepID=A0A4R2HPY5_9ACTN|nr:hypothetical protein [Kribbella steppae]TCO33029.1 hypothetical protein EV652_10328 [Kribbella steppae]
MATEIEGHASDLLEALYEAERAGTDEDEAIATYLEQAGLDAASYGFTVVDFLADHGMVERHHGFGKPRGRSTPAGMHAIQKLHVDRANPKIRAAALRTEMITWLDSQEERGTEPTSFQEFADSLESAEDGDSYSERELRGAAEYLQRHQLTESVHVEESSEGWIRPRLTVEGRECITDHAGDVAEYIRERRGGGPTTHHKTTVHISDNNGNLVINGDRFTQITAPVSISPSFSTSRAAFARCCRCSDSRPRRRETLQSWPMTGMPRPVHQRQTVIDCVGWSSGCLSVSTMPPQRSRRRCCSRPEKLRGRQSPAVEHCRSPARGGFRAMCRRAFG